MDKLAFIGSWIGTNIIREILDIIYCWSVGGTQNSE